MTIERIGDTDYEELTVDELDQLTVKVKTEQPARAKDHLRAIKAVRDAKVYVERQRDRAYKVFVTGYGLPPESVSKFLEGKSAQDISAILSPFDEIERQIGVTVEPGTGDLALDGKGGA